MDRPREHGEHLTFYEVGRTPLFASRYDQRLSYCLYVPDAYDEAGSDTWPLAVIVHGTARTATEYRDAFIDLAEDHGCVVLAPLFPAGLTEPLELDSYKFLDRGGIRFDLALLAIIDEVAATYRLRTDRFLLHGYSGGGQFAHRFLYLHPHRLLGCSIGAPGLVTLLDDTRPWWVGVADVEERFGLTIDLEALRAVPVQTVVGTEDVETWDINDPDSPNWMEGAYDAGPTRLERLRVLSGQLQGIGVDVTHVEVPGVAHDGFRVIDVVAGFFGRMLAA